MDVVEAVEAIKAAGILRPGKSLLRNLVILVHEFKNLRTQIILFLSFEKKKLTES